MKYSGNGSGMNWRHWDDRSPVGYHRVRTGLLVLPSKRSTPYYPGKAEGAAVKLNTSDLDMEDIEWQNEEDQKGL